MGAGWPLLASGDLSHCLTRLAPAGYNPRGAEFDRELVRLLSVPDVQGIMQMDESLVQEAAECGYRSILMMLGAWTGLKWRRKSSPTRGPSGSVTWWPPSDPARQTPERLPIKN